MTDLPATNNLVLARDGGVLRIWLDRIDARNALSQELVDELLAVLNAVRDDRSLRSIVLRGKGGVFCAGADIKGFKAGMQQTNAKQVARDNRRLGELMLTLNEQPQVMIALVEGAAIGGGLGLACCADVTLVTRDARFRLSETSLGLPPAQIAPFVIDQVGLAQARRLMLTGARFTGETALALGIAHGVANDSDDLEAQCNAVLAEINQCAPGANAVTKRILFEAMRRPRAGALDYAAEEFAHCMSGEEAQEGVSAFTEKRPAKWMQAPDEDAAE